MNMYTHIHIYNYICYTHWIGGFFFFMPMEYLCKLALKLATKWTLKKFKFSSDLKDTSSEENSLKREIRN